MRGHRIRANCSLGVYHKGAAICLSGKLFMSIHFLVIIVRALQIKSLKHLSHVTSSVGGVCSKVRWCLVCGLCVWLVVCGRTERAALLGSIFVSGHAQFPVSTGVWLVLLGDAARRPGTDMIMG
jgi:hypothetical protein